MIKNILKLVAANAVVIGSLYGGDNIVIGPPPVSYTTLKTVGSESSIGVNYMSYSADTMDMTGIGAGYSYTDKNNKDSLNYFAISYTSLSITGSGALSNTTGDGGIANASYLYGHNLSDELTGFVGANILYMNLETGVPVGSTSGLDVTIDTLMYGVNAGVQYDYPVSFGSVIPWAFASVTTGSSEIETRTYGVGGTTSSSSASIDPTFTYQFGFDIYFQAISSSLSSMYQSNDSGDLISLSYNYKF